MSESEEEPVAVPQMLRSEALTKILVAYLKVGADQAEKSSGEVAQVAGVSEGNISLNNKFFASIGLLEGRRGAYKLTHAGTEYARALDWGRLDEANGILSEAIKNKLMVQRTISYVSLNKPVSRDDLVARVATLANVKRESRFETGINAFLDILVLSGLLREDDGQISLGTRVEEPSEKVPGTPSLIKKEIEPSIHSPNLPITINLNIDSNTDIEKLKAILRAIFETLTTGHE